MIAALNKVIRVRRVARVSKADKVVKQVQEAVSRETRDSRVAQVGEVSKVNPDSRARDNKATCLTATASKASRKKLQIAGLHLMKMRIWSKENTKRQTGTRIQTAA
jgi:hypothetical protein